MTDLEPAANAAVAIDLDKLSEDYERVERTIGFLEENFRRQPSLEELAQNVGLSEFHFQRLFSRWVGISPKRFLQYLTKEYAKALLEESRNVLDVAYSAGLSGPSRLHDLFVTCEAVTPGQYIQQGEGISITYGIHPSPFGACLIAATERGICSLHFVQDDESPEGRLAGAWPRARVQRDQDGTRSLAETIFSFNPAQESAPLHVFVRGTNFQIKVWEALIRIPLGKAVTYEDIARHIGLPGATRAVGTAIGRNPIPFLIPCHRVIRKMGDFGNYGEGPRRKKAILGWEAAIHERLSL